MAIIKKKKKEEEKEGAIYSKEGKDFIVPEKEKKRLEAMGKLTEEQQIRENLQYQQRVKAAQQIPLTPGQEAELSATQKKQAKEQEEIAGLISEQKTPEASERAARAGAAFLTATGRFESQLSPLRLLGPKGEIIAEATTEGGVPSKLDFETMSPLAKAGLIAVGKITTVKVPIIGSISNIFDISTSATISEREKDAAEMTAQSDRINMNVWRKGSSVQQAITSQRQIEEGLRIRYNDMLYLLEESPSDQLKGKDVMDAMARDLQYVVGNRQALELYFITGDKTKLQELSLNSQAALIAAGLPLDILE